ncbi:hypothetical protein RSAG8_11694, partial [Rhizoctonia solani AG-8 WAC10335]
MRVAELYKGRVSGALIHTPVASFHSLTFKTCVQRSKFHLPSDPSVPLILVATGTGVAPFRGFVQRRAASHEYPGKILAFFGFRGQHEHLYTDELNPANLPSFMRVLTAYSREPGQSRAYAQDLMLQYMSDVIGMLDSGAAVYVCGSHDMGHGVHDTLIKIMKEGTVEYISIQTLKIKIEIVVENASAQTAHLPNDSPSCSSAMNHRANCQFQAEEDDLLLRMLLDDDDEDIYITRRWRQQLASQNGCGGKA